MKPPQKFRRKPSDKGKKDLITVKIHKKLLKISKIHLLALKVPLYIHSWKVVNSYERKTVCHIYWQLRLALLVGELVSLYSISLLPSVQVSHVTVPLLRVLASQRSLSYCEYDHEEMKGKEREGRKGTNICLIYNN